MSIFITGTGTDVGKTVITAGLAGALQDRGLQVGVFKPLQSGAVEINNQLTSPDLDFVKLISPDSIIKYSYLLRTPVCPTIAAENEGIKIDKRKLLSDYNELVAKCDIVLVEGAGGLLSPFFDNYLVRDIIRFLSIPVLIVARPDLGTINHTLLTIEAAKLHNIKILGIIISRYPEDTEDIAITTAPNLIHKFSKEVIVGAFPEINLSSNDVDIAELVKSKFTENVDVNHIIEFTGIHI